MKHKCRHIKDFRVLTIRDNASVRKCQLCDEKLTKENKRELISKQSKEDFAISTGIICDNCYMMLIMLPKDYWVAHSIWSDKLGDLAKKHDFRDLAKKHDFRGWDKVWKERPGFLQK